MRGSFSPVRSADSATSVNVAPSATIRVSSADKAIHRSSGADESMASRASEAVKLHESVIGHLSSRFKRQNLTWCYKDDWCRAFVGEKPTKVAVWTIPPLYLVAQVLRARRGHFHGPWRGKKSATWQPRACASNAIVPSVTFPPRSIFRIPWRVMLARAASSDLVRPARRRAAPSSFTKADNTGRMTSPGGVMGYAAFFSALSSSPTISSIDQT
jgi:hypothetical protein